MVMYYAVLSQPSLSHAVDTLSFCVTLCCHNQGMCHAVDTLSFRVTLCCHLQVCVTPLIRYGSVLGCVVTTKFVLRR